MIIIGSDRDLTVTDRLRSRPGAKMSYKLIVSDSTGKIQQFICNSRHIRNDVRIGPIPYAAKPIQQLTSASTSLLHVNIRCPVPVGEPKHIVKFRSPTPTVNELAD